MPFSVKILRFFGILLLSLCALGVAGMTWAYLIEPNLLFVRKVDYRVPQWKGKGTPVKVVIAGDLHLMPTAFDEVRALRYVQRIMRLRPDLILLVGDYARGSSENASMDPATAARLLKGLTAPCGVFAIQGNHDFTFGWNNWSRELKQAGITVWKTRARLSRSRTEGSFSFPEYWIRRAMSENGCPNASRRTSPISCFPTVRKRTAYFPMETWTSSSAGTPTEARFALLSASCGLKPARTMPYPTPIPGISPAAIPT